MLLRMPHIPHIYTANRFSALQAKQQELERQQNTDSLRKHLEKRPEREELVERILFYPSPPLHVLVLMLDRKHPPPRPHSTRPRRKPEISRKANDRRLP
jgi:hypothetical protein